VELARGATTLARGALALLAVLAPAACGPKRPVATNHDAGDAGAADAGAIDATADEAEVATDDAGARGGRIKVTVTWPTAPPAVRASPGYTACHTPKRPRARIGTLHGVAGVLVVVDDAPATATGVDAGTGGAPPAPSPRIVIRDCLPSPPIALAPSDAAAIELQNQDERPHAATIEPLGAAWRAGAAPPAGATARAQLPALGHTVTVPLDGPGVWRLAVDDAWAYVVSAPHAAITDDVGQVGLPALPPGTYAVTAWLPPTAPGQPDQRATGTLAVPGGDLTLSF